MEKIIIKYNSLVQALESLHRALIVLEQTHNNINTNFLLRKKEIPLYEQEVMLGLRDSTIQRFEYSIDLLWKYLQIYLEEILKVVPEFRGPKNILKECCKARLLTEQETMQAIQMLDDRNLSSHIYKEEIAQQIANAIPGYYQFMIHVIEKTKPN